MKDVLKDFPNLTGLWISETGEWYFEKPSHVETEFASREDILKEDKKK